MLVGSTCGVQSVFNHNGVFTLLFSVVYTNELLELSASEVPVVGSTKRLVCNADKRGFPEEVKAVRWYKNGDKISEKEKYQMVGM